MNRAVWKVEIPREGPYYLWLRHLLRGTGSRGADVRQEIRALVNGKPVVTLGGGPTDLNAPDTFIAEGHPLAEQLWTWAWPGDANLEPVMLPAGDIEIALENFPDTVRYDVLLITDEPSTVPQDGRLRQR